MSLIKRIVYTLSSLKEASKRVGNPVIQSSPPILIEKADGPKMYATISECLANVGRAEILKSEKILSPDFEYLKQLTNKYSQTDAQISQTMKDVIAYLERISSNLAEASAAGNECEDALAKKAVVDYLIEHVSYNENFLGFDRPVGFEFDLPTKKINRNHLNELKEEFDKSVSCFKKEGILSISDYDTKKYQFDAEDIMKRYEQKSHDANYRQYRELFDPIERLKGSLFCCDPYLDSHANFYRIISPDELRNLIHTKKTKKFIDSDGYYTSGHYSCITANPNYNEQAFAANGLPIRLKFKTKDSDGLYNMNLLNRIRSIKPERSIYKVNGYNFYDIDWNNVCVNNGSGWAYLDKDFIEELILKHST